MLKKLFVTAAAAAAVSVPLAGVASADKGAIPTGNGLGQGGMPDKATAFTKAAFPEVDAAGGFDQFESGKSGNIPPGAAYSLGAKTDCAGQPCNAPDGYSQALSDFYTANGLPGAVPPGPVPGTTVVVEGANPGAVTRLFTPQCTKSKAPHPTISVNGRHTHTLPRASKRRAPPHPKLVRAARIPFLGCGRFPVCAPFR